MRKQKKTVRHIKEHWTDLFKKETRSETVEHRLPLAAWIYLNLQKDQSERIFHLSVSCRKQEKDGKWAVKMRRQLHFTRLQSKQSFYESIQHRTERRKHRGLRTGSKWRIWLSRYKSTVKGNKCPEPRMPINELHKARIGFVCTTRALGERKSACNRRDIRQTNKRTAIFVCKLNSDVLRQICPTLWHFAKRWEWTWLEKYRETDRDDGRSFALDIDLSGKCWRKRDCFLLTQHQH